MSNSLRLKLSKDDHTIGEIDVTPVKPKASHSSLDIFIGIFFLFSSLLALYCVIYLIFA